MLYIMSVTGSQSLPLVSMNSFIWIFSALLNISVFTLLVYQKQKAIFIHLTSVEDSSSNISLSLIACVPFNVDIPSMHSTLAF